MYRQMFNSHREQYQDFNPIFTDGSKNDGHTASAVVTPNEIITEKLHPSCSVFTCEAHAILLALQFILTQTHKKWYIYTDSKSCLAALNNISHRSHSIIINVVYTYENLQSLGYSVMLSWIPGHCGILGNEKADEFAKLTQNLSVRPLSYSDIRNAINFTLQFEWQKSWNEETNNKLHSLIPNIEPVMKQSLPRKYEVILNRLRIGHTRITHRHLLLSEPAPDCSSCNEPLTVKHALIQCNKFKFLRQRYFGYNNPTLHLLIGDKPHYNLLLYLKDIGFYNSI
nr:uncharacterized protein LOC122271920 isoform X1 [Parasteatoda tepidariorum]XP_042910587.1 uncharacterized protein LOC122271920 isoform X2 [Parasteatoda tepidariorum]